MNVFAFFYGVDAYRIRRESLLLRERFFGGKEMNFCVKRFDFTDGDFSWEDFLREFQDNGLFSEKRCTVASGIFSLPEKKRENLKSWIETNSRRESDSVLCIFEEIKPDKRLSLYKTLQKFCSQTKEFFPLGEREIWIEAENIGRTKFSKVDFDRDAFRMLVEGCGNDLFWLENEMEKVFTYVGGNGRVTAKDVRLISSVGIFDDIFHTLESIGKGDKKEALKLFFRQARKGDHPIALLSMCAYHIRTMLLVGECLQKGIFDVTAIARKVGIHPFSAKKAVSQIQSFTLERAKKAFHMLGRYDILIKTGKIDAGLALEEFVLRV